MLLSSSNRKYQPYPLSYFSVFVCLIFLLPHILSLLHTHSGKTGILFSLLLCSLLWVRIVGYVLAWRSCSFVCTLHHHIIINVQTYLKPLNLSNACQIYFVECVSKIEHIFSVIHCPLYGAVCFQFTQYTFCLIIIIRSEIWIIIHCLGLGSETMVCAVCLSIFLWYWWKIYVSCK